MSSIRPSIRKHQRLILLLTSLANNQEPSETAGGVCPRKSLTDFTPLEAVLFVFQESIDLAIEQVQLLRVLFDSRFTAQHMAQNYLKLYSRLMKSRAKAPAMAADPIMAQGQALAAHAAAMAAAPGFNVVAGA